MINQYKRVDVFRCLNQAHAKLGKRVSVYHVLKVKKCYPNGCVYSKWRCEKFQKGDSCPRGYKHVGRLCFGCKYFYDEKITHQLQMVLPDEKQQSFWDDLEVFEDWLNEVRGKRTQVFGTISAVKPRLEKHILGRESRLQIRGFLLVFKESFIGQTPFDDFTYALVGRTLQQTHAFRPGDSLEFTAEIHEDRGRIIYEKLRRIEFSSRGETAGNDWQKNLAFLRSSATGFSAQPEKCLYCPYGTLVDVFETNGDGQQRYRRLYCLKGVRNPNDCVEQVLERMAAEGCPEEQ